MIFIIINLFKLNQIFKNYQNYYHLNCFFMNPIIFDIMFNCYIISFIAFHSMIIINLHIKLIYL